VRGSQLKLLLTNLDTANSMTITVMVTETTHHIARDDMRCSNVNASTSMPVYGFWPDAYPQIGLLGAGTVSVPASSTVKLLDYMYSGLIQYSYNGGGTTLTLQIRLPDCLPASIGGNAFFWSDALSSSAISHTFIAPRCPIMITVANSSATTAQNVNFAANSLEYAS
jgi:hypothetical protein